MRETDLVLRALLAIGGFPLAAWIGGVLLRPGRTLHAIVARNLRLIVIGLVLLNIVSGLADGVPRSRLGMGVELASAYGIALLFVPMLRRLQQRTELARAHGIGREQK